LAQANFLLEMPHPKEPRQPRAQSVHQPWIPGETAQGVEAPVHDWASGFHQEVSDAKATLEKRTKLAGPVATIGFAGRRPFAWLSFLGITATSGLATMRGIEYDRTNRRSERQSAQRFVSEVASSLEQQVKTSVSSVYAVAAFIEVIDRQVLGDNFPSIAQTLIDTYGGISNLQLQPFGNVWKIHPLAGNEGAIGHALLIDPNRVSAAVSTISKQAATFVGPLKLVQGGIAVIVRYPVFTSTAPRAIPDILTWWPSWSHGCCNRSTVLPEHSAFPGPLKGGNATNFWGFVGMLALVDKLVENLHLEDTSRGMDLQLRTLNKHPSVDSDVFAFSPGAPPSKELKDPVRAAVSIPELNVAWDFACAPSTGWTELSSAFVTQILLIWLGYLISLALLFVKESYGASHKATHIGLQRVIDRLLDKLSQLQGKRGGPSASV